MPRRHALTRAFLFIAASAGTATIACGIDLTGSRSVPDPIVDSGVDVTPNLPPPSSGVDAGVDATSSGCPIVKAGSALIRAPGAPFCIDATEVSNADYDAFLGATDGGGVEAGVVDGGLPGACAALTTFDRVGAATFTPDDPVSNVPWCAAYAYCAWAGKRLCTGQTAADGGTSAGEWYTACSASGTRLLPYGDAAVPGACAVADASLSAVGSHAGCRGALVGLADMVGNVGEWLGSCDDDAGTCPVAGGDYTTALDSATCKSSVDLPREATASGVGFRCCADVEN